MKRALFSIFFLIISVSAARAELKTVVSIKPIHSLVAAMMVGTKHSPDVLIDGTASPHGYALKPSQVALLDRAELVVWIAPELESFLKKPLQTVAKDASIITLMDAKGLTIHAASDHHDHGDHGEEHHDEHADEHHGEEHHDEHHDEHKDEANAMGNDPHIWLDPENAARMVDALHERLVALDPKNATLYQVNKDKLQQRLSALDTEVRAMLTPLKSHNYMVFHNAFSYFTRHYGLQDAGVISNNPEVQPSVAEVNKAKDYFHDHKINCVFVEPQFPKNRIEAVRENHHAKVGTLDPLGAALPAGPELYFSLIRNLAQSMQNCLEV